MAEISNDDQLRKAIVNLPLPQQRSAAALFVENVAALSDDPRIKRAIDVAKNSEATASELDDALASVKKLAVETYTSCGTDADWLIQAVHFVAAAAAAAVAPESQFSATGNPAWKAAMQARMARNCEMIATDKGEPGNEAEDQYRIMSRFIGSG